MSENVETIEEPTHFRWECSKTPALIAASLFRMELVAHLVQLQSLQSDKVQSSQGNESSEKSGDPTDCSPLIRFESPPGTASQSYSSLLLPRPMDHRPGTSDDIPLWGWQNTIEFTYH